MKWTFSALNDGGSSEIGSAARATATRIATIQIDDCEIILEDKVNGGQRNERIKEGTDEGKDNKENDREVKNSIMGRSKLIRAIID